MEDVATAEISRAQLWQWVRAGVSLDDGRAVTKELYEQIREEELAKLGGKEVGRVGEAAEVLDELVLGDEFTEFLTFIAYKYL